MTITPTDFRKDLFNLLDMLLDTGKVLEINRNGHIFRVIPPKKIKKLDRLIAHRDAIIGDSDDFVSMKKQKNTPAVESPLFCWVRIGLWQRMRKLT